MNVSLERKLIGKQPDESPLYDLRIIVDGADVVPDDRTRHAFLAALLLLRPAPKVDHAHPAPHATPPKPSDK